MKPNIPPNEKKRLEVLKSYHILDSLPEQAYDDLTLIASQICGVPISLISLIDEERQWFKSKHGLNAPSTEREHAFCAHAINYADDIFTVPDSRVDERFRDNPLVTGDPHVVFYTGVPIVTEDGLALGTLCVIDNQPRELSSDQMKALKALSNQVMQLLELRRNKLILEEKNLFLNQFAAVAAHDIKAPLHNLNMLADLLLSDHAPAFNAEHVQFLKMISTSALQLQLLVNSILSYSKNIDQIKNDYSLFDPKLCWKEVLSMVECPPNAELHFQSDINEIHGHFTLWCQIITNLLQNGIKYNHQEKIVIQCSIQESDEAYTLNVQDNGDGIPEESLTSIFEPFKTLVSKDRFGKKGHGLGLAMVKKWIDHLGGEIHVTSQVHQGTTFQISLPK
ncbi:MAG: hypothetical protein RLY35_1895 [Bacteroidota bacterium]